MSERVRPYLFYDLTISICTTCYRRVEAKLVLEDGRVLMIKRCPEHGLEKVLIADDADYYRRAREDFLKAPEMPRAYRTPVEYGCPYDCGLCPDHEQHSCLTLIEIADRCNLRCPVCYSSSGPDRREIASLASIEAMFDAMIRSEGEADVVQISGGEPTVHPEFFRVLDMARERPIRHRMINTNGVRIAEDAEFAARLADYMPGFEVYLQFDSMEERALVTLRGEDLRRTREKALEHLDAAGVSTTLVCTVMRGLNDHELGRIVEHATTIPCVRGVTFQPVQEAGRCEPSGRPFDRTKDRLTLTEVRRRILEQAGVFRPEDVMPVPCHPDCLAMAYGIRDREDPTRIVPLTGELDPRLVVEGARNTITYETDDAVRAGLFALLSLGDGPPEAAGRLRDLLCCLPRIDAPDSLDYGDLFRVLIVQFIDAAGFDVRSIKKTCVHVARPDGRMIPLDAYNLFYRDDLEKTRLAPLRGAAAPL